VVGHDQVHVSDAGQVCHGRSIYQT
jgi:hypothetical protein